MDKWKVKKIVMTQKWEMITDYLVFELNSLNN